MEDVWSDAAQTPEDIPGYGDTRFSATGEYARRVQLAYFDALGGPDLADRDVATDEIIDYLYAAEHQVQVKEPDSPVLVGHP